MKYGVPVAISTDDEGVARSDMTHEYLRAVEGYRLSYTELKRMARQSLEHSFLPGQSLVGGNKRRIPPGAVCAADPREAKPSHACGEFLAANERRARTMEAGNEFAKFEKKF